MRKINLLSIAAVLMFVVGSVSAQTPVVIDGSFDAAEWASAMKYTFKVIMPNGSTTPGELYIQNDAANLYFCIRVKETSMSPTSSLVVSLDSNFDRVISAGDDELVLNVSNAWCSYSKTFTDTVRYTGGACPAGYLCSGDDTSLGGTKDGNGAADNDGSWTTYEMWHPRASADVANDVQWYKPAKVGVAVMIRLFDLSGAMADTFYPGPYYGGFTGYYVH